MASGSRPLVARARRSRWPGGALLACAGAAWCAGGADAAARALTAPVNDFANVIDAASASELDRRIRALQAATGDVVVVATVPTFQPYGDIDEYAVKMFENGGAGHRRNAARTTACSSCVAVEDRKVGDRGWLRPRSSSSPTASPGRRSARRCCRSSATATTGAAWSPAPPGSSTASPTGAASACRTCRAAHRPARPPVQHPVPGDPARLIILIMMMSRGAAASAAAALGRAVERLEQRRRAVRRVGGIRRRLRRVRRRLVEAAAEASADSAAAAAAAAAPAAAGRG